VLSRRPADEPAAGGVDRDFTPEEEQAWREGLERLAHDKAEALSDPGPSWREWFFFDHAKWWVGVGFLILDTWVVASWISGGVDTSWAVLGACASLVGALYLEFLLYRYLWRRPSEDAPRAGRRFRPSWTGLTEFGRWTPEGVRARQAGARGAIDDGSASPHEFL